MIPTVRRIGGLRFEFEAADYSEAFQTFYAMVTICWRCLSRCLRISLTTTSMLVPPPKTLAGGSNAGDRCGRKTATRGTQRRRS